MRVVCYYVLFVCLLLPHNSNSELLLDVSHQALKLYFYIILNTVQNQKIANKIANTVGKQMMTVSV